MDPQEHELDPLAYHLELRDYLRAHEPELWEWFASARAQADYTERLRLELLKATYRLEPDGHPDLYRGLEQVKTRLELDIPVTVYQAQSNSEPNATLYFIPGEGHVVLSGPVLTLLNAEELNSVLGHELAHYRLWQWEQGDLHIADRLLQAVVNNPRAAASHEQTARRFQLYTEVFADRGSLRAVGELHPVVAGLVKIQTGLSQVSGAAYLKQAGEIFSKGDVAAEGISHPESFIRARALALWQEQGHLAAPSIARMIEGAETLDELDLTGQLRLTRHTRRLLEYFLEPRWFQTPAVLGLAKLFFADFRPATTREPAVLAEVKPSEAGLREYFCYLLLDFVTVDPELEEMPLAAAFELSRQLEMDALFEKLVVRELKRKVREVRKVKEQAAEMLAQAEVTGE